MPRVTAEEFASKWKRNLDASTPDIEAGVRRVTVAPGIKAADAAPKFLQKITESVQEGRWQAGVAAVSLPDWQKSMIEKGIPRISIGTAQAIPKQVKFATALFPAIDAAVATLEQMPSITFENNLARATAFMREMHKFQYKGV